MKHQKGFTLIELLVVIVILGIMSMIGLGFLTNSSGNGMMYDEYVRECLMEHELTAQECKDNAAELFGTTEAVNTEVLR